MNTVLVGDPVDVVTGAQFDVALDFQLAWSFPFEWRRFYSTARIHEHLPLGWGHTHSYDHRLAFDVDGLLYTDPAGGRHGFSVPAGDGLSTAAPDGVLRRITASTFQVKVGGQPSCEFTFLDPARPAQLRSVSRGRARHELLYDANGGWTEVACKREPRIGVVRDANGHIAALIWVGADHGRDVTLWQAAYDERGHLTSITDVYRTTQTFTYDANGRMTGRTDRRGYRFVASYDASGRCTRSATEDGVGDVRLRYLQPEGATVVTRADDGEWQYFYRPEGVTQIVDPYGGVTQRTYGPDGRLVREMGPSGEVLRQIVDEESGLLRDPYGRPAGATQLLGDPWFEALRDRQVPGDALGWDGYGKGRVRSAIRLPRKGDAWVRNLPVAVAAALRFAERPEEATAASPPGGAGPFPKKPLGVPDAPGVLRRDPFGRLVSHTLPSGESCRWQYDPNGNVIRYVDYAGSEWRYEYASWNLQVRETSPLGHATSFAYNRLEQRTRVTDAGGTSTEHAFDLKDRLSERRRHDRVRDRFAYNPSRALAAISTGNDQVRVRLSSGPHRRPVRIEPAGAPARECAYDDRGRLVAIATDDGHAQRFAYDQWGDRTADVRDGRGVRSRYAGSRIAEWVVLDRFVTAYTYDAATRRSTIVDPAGGRHVVAQLDAGTFVRKHANGTDELSQYDWSGRCLARVRFRGQESGHTWSRTFRYSPVGALVGAADSRHGAWEFQYDAAHRLTGATGPRKEQLAYVYDPAGNLLGAPGLERTSCEENRLVAANGRRFRYDERHHVAGEEGHLEDRVYTYDVEDRLTSCRTGGSTIEFAYDALGRRVSKSSAGRRHEFIWDGERLAAEISADGAVRVYVYADDVARTPFAFIDYESLAADPAAGRRRYIFSDQTSCPILVEDDAGEILWRADIDPYGRASVDPGSTLELNLRRPGHYYDPETGLHYNRHRYYSPELGRYLQVDPRDLEGGLNLYAYPARPLDTVDVDGLAPCPKKPMVQVDEDAPGFKEARDRADQVADDMRQALKDAVDNGEMHPLAASGTTLAAMVVQRADGTFEVVVTGNRSDLRLPQGVQEAMGDHRFIAHGDDRPPPVRQSDEDWRYGRDNPRTDERQESTHNHAEQRGLRAADCDPETQGVAYVAPTRPCCEGCSSAIQTPHSDGGWGGTDSNVSDLGRQPGSHGDWW